MENHIDIVGLVTQALQDMGCEEKLDDALSPHMPISINFRDGSEIRIETTADGVHFVAPMPPVTEAVLTHASTLVATFVLRPASPLFSPCRPVVVWYDDKLSLQGRLSADAQTMPAFREALEYFFEEMCALMQIVGS